MIYHGDCLEYLRKCVRTKCFFADPPDNIGLAYRSGFDDKRKPDDYYNWLRLLILEALPKCELFWMTYYPAHDIELSYIIRDIIKYRHQSWKVDKYIWRYTFSQYNDRDCSYGYRPVIRFRAAMAKIYVDPIREVSKRQLIGDSRAAGLRVPDNVWTHMPRVVGNSPERVDWMPTQLPIALLRKTMLMSVAEDEVFTDLFGGSGSALMAALELGRLDKTNVVEQDLISCENIRTRVYGTDPVIIQKVGDML